MKVLTRFDLIGGQPVVDRLVDAFYRRMDDDPSVAGIRKMHGRDLTPVANVLKRYLGEWLGGPALYSAERGHPRLRMRHIRFSVGPAERDAWMRCMDAALQEVVADTALRQALHDAFYKLADWVRNDPENAHDKQRDHTAANH